MPRSSKTEVEAHMLDILRYICERGDAGLCVSQARLAQVMNSTSSRVRFALARLNESGYMQVDTRYLPNGGQLENRYLATEKGIEVVESYERRTNEQALRG